MTDKIKEAAINFLAEIEASIRGWKPPFDENARARISELKCVLNSAGASELRKAIGKVASRKAKQKAATWWDNDYPHQE